MKGWQQEQWLCPWLERPRDLLETYLLLPGFSVSLWMCSLFGRWFPLPTWTLFVLASLVAVVIIWALLAAWVKVQRKSEEAPADVEP